MTSEELAVWLYGERIATIDRRRDRLRLAYTDGALARYPLGTPLSVCPRPIPMG